jgi:hypothetical protein
MITKEPEFNYVIARKWFDNTNQLCCYSYHNTVFYGTMKDAQDTLEFIKGRADEKADEYLIYKVSDEPVKEA